MVQLLRGKQWVEVKTFPLFRTSMGGRVNPQAERPESYRDTSSIYPASSQILLDEETLL